MHFRTQRFTTVSCAAVPVRLTSSLFIESGLDLSCGSPFSLQFQASPHQSQCAAAHKQENNEEDLNY